MRHDLSGRRAARASSTAAANKASSSGSRMGLRFDSAMHSV